MRRASAARERAYDDQRVAIVLDHATEDNGVAYFYEGFLSHCEQRGLCPLVIGDSPNLRIDHTHVRYHASERLPHDLIAWIGPHGVASRPFIVLGDDQVGAAESRAQQALRARLAQTMERAEVALLDSLAHGSWLADLAEELSEKFRRHRVRRLYLPTQSFLGFAAATAAAARVGIEVVHGVHTDYPGFFFERLMNAAGVGDRAVFLPLRAAMYRRIAERALGSGGEILFPTAAALSAYGPHLRTGSRYDTQALRGGVDVGRFRLRSSANREEQWVVAYFGRLEHDKNAALVPAIAALSTGVGGWRIIGDGSLRPELEAAMPDAQFFGHLTGEHLVQQLQSVDACVFPSVHDTFALAVLEVMACGVPVVVTDVGGPASYICHERTGLVVPATAEALSDALRRLHAEPLLAAKLSKHARSYAESQSWEEIFAALAFRLFRSERSDRRRRPVTSISGQYSSARKPMRAPTVGIG